MNIGIQGEIISEDHKKTDLKIGGSTFGEDFSWYINKTKTGLLESAYILFDQFINISMGKVE